MMLHRNGPPIRQVDDETLGVLAAEELSLPSASDELALYGLKLATDKGDLVLDYRNESNGYYGGNLSWPGEYHYGGVYGQNNSKEEWDSASGVKDVGKP